MWQTGKTEIGRVHVRLRGDVDRRALRLRLDSLLGTATWHPPGMSPAAVLVVQRMADPLPGALALNRRAARVDPAWDRAMRDALANVYRRAASPARGVVSLDAPAALFSDEAEMLACLALDLSRGAAYSRWWWQAALRTLPALASSALEALLCGQAHLVPAAFDCLAGWGQAAPVVGALSTAQAATVLAAVGRACGLAALDLGRVVSLGAEEAGASVPGKPSPLLGANTHTPGARQPPWAHLLPTGLVPPALDRERACLLGVAITLHRRPGIARSRAFLCAVRDWWIAAPTITVDGASLPRVPPPPVTSRAPLAPPEAGAVPEPLVQSRQAPTNDKSAQWQREDAAVPPGDRGQPPRAPWAQALAGPPGALLQDSLAGTNSATDHHNRRLGPQPAPAAAPEGVAAPTHQGAVLWPEAGVATQVGGVLYLINLMHYLDLPACFEETWRLDSQVGPWGVLDALGRALLPEAGDHLADDPLWQALAALDDRAPGEMPRQGLGNSDVFRLPAPWLAPLDNDESGPWYWATDGKHLWLWSGQGYLLVDLPVSGDEEAGTAASEEMRCYLGDPNVSGGSSLALVRRPPGEVPLARLTGTLAETLGPGLVAWLARVLSYVRFRLRCALNPAGDEPWSVARALLLVPGRVYVTPSHVDLVMPLDAVSLPVRLAGFDFDPGWLPDWGRVVQFHFE